MYDLKSLSIQLIGPWEMHYNLELKIFQTQIMDRYLDNFLCNRPQVNATVSHW